MGNCGSKKKVQRVPFMFPPGFSDTMARAASTPLDSAWADLGYSVSRYDIT